MKLGALLCTAVAAAALATSSFAATLVDTGEPAGDIVWSLYNTGQNYQFLAARFELTQAATITGLEGAITGEGTFTVGLAFNGGNLPNDTLYSAEATTSGGTWSGLSGLHLALGPGLYWITFTVEDGQTLVGGMRNTPPSALVDEAYKNDSTGGDWVDGDFLDIGVRVFGDVGSAAPEPATWALMIGGFAFAGGALRRRRPAVA